MRPSQLRLLILLLAVLGGVGSLRAADAEPEGKPVAELGIADAIVLGVVEGVTEFLPISSTGHLIIVSDLLGLESDRPLKGKRGEPLWYHRPSAANPSGAPLTLKLAADTYAVIIQVGAITAVLLLYWTRIMNMALGLLGRNSAGLRLLRNILAAFVPVAGAGLLLHDWIDRHLFSVGAVIGSLVVGALLMFWAERWRRTNTGLGFSRREPSDLTLRQSASIGIVQCLALWPGTSRSMVTIVGGYLAGLNRVAAAEFSFLAGLPVLAGAATYKAWRSGPAMIEVFGWAHVVLGALVAAISAALAVKFLVRFLSRHGLAVFAWYRLALALVLALFYLL